jgi:hypothetical protein
MSRKATRRPWLAVPGTVQLRWMQVLVGSTVGLGGGGMRQADEDAVAYSPPLVPGALHLSEEEAAVIRAERPRGETAMAVTGGGTRRATSVGAALRRSV